MVEKVIRNRIKTKLDLNPSEVLEDAKKANLETVIVLGETKEGKWFLSSSTTKLPEINLIIDSVHHKIIRGDFG